MTSTRKMKLAALLTASVLGLAACGNGDADTANPGTDPSNGEQTAAQSGDRPEWCGDEEISLALLDGFGGNGWRAIAAASGRAEAEKCPSVTSFEYVDGQGDTQKSISDIQAMAATGIDAMVVFPDAGEAVLPAIRSAYEAGVTTVPYRADPGGTPGEDYDVWVGTDFYQDGVDWGNWIANEFPDGANIIFLGGPAGSSQGISEREGLESVLSDAKYKMIGEQPFEVTNWDPSVMQQVLTAAIAKHDQIDVIVTDYGPGLVGALPQFANQGKTIPALAGSDANVLGCFWEDNKDEHPTFKMANVNTGIDNVRLAIQHAVAIASGGTQPDITDWTGGIFEDSEDPSKPIQCDRNLPDDVYLSAEMSGEDQAEVIG
ncbi:substrate-binding domain-containing protein [Tessaracoccus sp. MC1756]|uniref:substrate-binding domain-containing protein n=1 Tax=Tessaracoccus sp. MC1756 TaxID=2760311 RepID=UPI001601590B|nr:substrate-binding domain-containing protein [Tessaracoccus sp. MC1756]MBB1510941.1 substrate-binding domain-containing protein [Tessaracoccus sp. MC1756]